MLMRGQLATPTGKGRCLASTARRCLLFAAFVLAAHTPARANAQTLSQLLAQNGVALDPVDARRGSREITSYAVGRADDMVAVAYYWSTGGNHLDDTLNVSVYGRATGSWTHAALSREELGRKSPTAARGVGSAIRISVTREHLIIDTHINPSAGTILVLTRGLNFMSALDGWTEAILPRGAIVYQKSMVHFAPTHPAELWIHDPTTLRNAALYPTQPYDSVRSSYIRRVREIYTRLGDDWFRLNNHHMMAELFESRIGTPIADNSGTRIAFVAMFGEGGGSRAATPLVEVLVVCENVLLESRCSETELSAARVAHPDWPTERFLADALGRGGPIQEQRPVVPPDAQLVQIAPSRMALQGGKGLAGATKFLVPTALLHLSIDGDMRASSALVRGSATVRGDYRVRGLRKSFVTELAATVERDLQHRLAAGGATVLTYADIENNSLLPPIARMPVDTLYKTPIVKLNSARTTFSVIAPSDAQAFGGAAFRKHLPFREIARQTGAVVVIPELWFTAPQLDRVTGGQYGGLTSTLSVSAGMDLHQAGLTFITPSGAVGVITLMSPLANLDAGVGELVQVFTESVTLDAPVSASGLLILSDAGFIGLSSARAPGGNRVRLSSFDFVVFEPTYSPALVRGAVSFLKAAVSLIERERRRQ